MKVNTELTEMFKVVSGKSYTVYSVEDGKYYRQHMTWWEKGGYCIPQTRKKISESEYYRMKEAWEQN